jgi:hypothetical protein
VIAMPITLRILPLLACLLAGCSAQILEEVGEVSAPRDCAETTKLFNTFSMRATRTSWKGTKSDPSATLTLEIVFANDKGRPIALSNSGAGVLYTVEFSLQGNNGISHKPKEAIGVTYPSEAKKPREARDLPFFSEQKIARAKPPKTETNRDVNFRIRPGEPEAGKLVFQVPKDNYLLIVQRKFAGKPVAGMPADHLSACKVSGNGTATTIQGGRRRAVVEPSPATL